MGVASQMRNVYISQFFAEKIAQRKARESLFAKCFRFFGFSKCFSNGYHLFGSAQIFGSGFETQRQQFLGFLQFASARLHFRKTHRSGSAILGQQQSLPVSVARLFLSFEPFISNSQIVGGFRVAGVPVMDLNKARERFLKAIQAGVQASRGF